MVHAFAAARQRGLHEAHMDCRLETRIRYLVCIMHNKGSGSFDMNMRINAAE